MSLAATGLGALATGHDVLPDLPHPHAEHRLDALRDPWWDYLALAKARTR